MGEGGVAAYGRLWSRAASISLILGRECGLRILGVDGGCSVVKESVPV